MTIGIVGIVTAAKRDDLNLVFAARGMGPECVTRKVCAVDAQATHETAPTHWLWSDANGSAEELATLNGMINGDLPPVPDGTVWGENGVISAANAMAATDGAVMQVYSCAGDVEPVDHIAAVLASRNLQYVPDPPL
jgi:hypothetical protein